MTKEELALFEKILKATGDIAKAQSAVAERLQKIEDNAEARNALAGGGTGFTAPEERGAAPPPPTPATLPAKRDPADEEREGKIDPCAFMRMVVFSKMYGMADAAMMNCDKGSQGYKDAEYTLALTRLATMTRDAAIGTGGAGGFIAPEEWQVRMIELLRDKLIAVAAGVELMPGQTNAVVRIPRQSASGTGYWVGENAAITPSQQTYEQLTLTPKIAAGLTKASMQFIKYSNPSAAAVIERDLVATLQRLIDLAIFRGTGVGDQPTGIANTSGITAVAWGSNGEEPTQIRLEKMRLALHEAKSLEQKVTWVTPPKGQSSIRSILDGNDRPIYLEHQNPLAPTSPGQLFGWPVLPNTQLPTNLTKGGSTDCYEIFLADFAEVFVPMWGGMEVAATGETTTAFTNLQSWIRVHQELDVGVRHPEACVLVSDARPTAGLV